MLPQTGLPEQHQAHCSPVPLFSKHRVLSPDPPPAAEARGAGGQAGPHPAAQGPDPQAGAWSSEGHEREPEEHTGKVTITKILVCIYSPNYAVRFTAAKSVTEADSEAAILAELGTRPGRRAPGSS